MKHAIHAQPRPRWRASHCWPAVLLLVGCTKSLDTPADGALPTGPTGVSTTGAVTGSGGAGAVTSDAGTTTGSGVGGTQALPGDVPLDVGRTVIRRLTAPEYNNTVRDLMLTNLRPADDFTNSDTVSDQGFDTIGAVLTVPPVLVEQYEASARRLVDELFARPDGDSVKGAILTCDTSVETCARSVLQSFAERAFRRPADSAEIDRLMALRTTVDGLGGPAEDGMKAALAGVLLSPHFIFRVERFSPGDTTARPVSGPELATRLSYFLWSSMPDDELSQLAQSGTLVDNLGAQVQRMLDSEKATEFANNFAGQWLAVRHMEDFEPPSQLVFPEYDEALSAAAKQETLLFFERLVRDGMPLTDLLSADYSIINSRLGELYDIPVTGTGYEDVSLTNTPRRGYLTQASFLMISSHPGSTSPARRGDMVFKRLLCDAIPPPPAGVEVDLPTPEPGMTRREQLELHRADPSCAACHNALDPIGFGFENFDAMGAYRSEENGAAVNASGLLPTATGEVAFSGPEELSPLIAQDPRFARCATEKLLTYAVGRRFDLADAKAYTTALTDLAVSAGTPNWRAFIEQVARSDAFLTGRGEAQ